MLAIVFLLGLVAFFLRERNLVLHASPEVNINDLTKSDCGVVLTGSAGRIREAFEVMALKKIDKLIVSGVYKDTKLHEILPQLQDFPDIHPENIILEKVSGSTYQNAQQSLLLVQSLACQNILLMTSQLHMYRALKTFKAHFPVSIKIHSYPIVNQTKEDSELAIQFETIKSLFYSVTPFVQFALIKTTQPE
ncbi:MAG: YdcF family protein [Bdellovibrionota bacterium]